MTTSSELIFNKNYQAHLKHLKLKGLRPKTIEAYSRAIRRIGKHFDYQINSLDEAQLLDYFSTLLSTHSWSAVKLDLYGLKFFYQHVLHKPWSNIDLMTCMDALMQQLQDAKELPNHPRPHDYLMC